MASEVAQPADRRTDARGYTRRWKKYRVGWLRQHPLCGDRLDGQSSEHSLCARAGRAVPATDVDHIIPHRGDMDRFWDPRNHQSLCGPCHDSVKSQLERSGIVKGCDENGLPLDPQHPWNRGVA